MYTFLQTINFLRKWIQFFLREVERPRQFVYPGYGIEKCTESEVRQFSFWEGLYSGGCEINQAWK